MFARFLGTSIFASGITLSLFWIMTALIAVEDVPLKPSDLPVVKIVKVMKAQEPIPEDTIVPIKHEPLVEPKIPNLTSDPGEGIQVGPGNQNTVDPFEGTGHSIAGLTPPEGDATPIVRIAPRYPERALARGIEGRVLVEFTITTAGTVTDARVIAAEPRGIFDKAALDAVSQWRYSPKIENGRATERRGLRISIPFRNGGSSST